MATSRLSRVEEKRTKTRLYKIVGTSVLILILLIALGIPLLVKVSALLGSINSSGTNPDSTDKTPPFAPVLSSINSATNSAQLKIEGYAEAESTIILKINGDIVKEELLSLDGNFSFTDLKLETGSNTIYATAIDKAGNESAISNELTVYFKKGAPTIELLEPAENQSYGKNQQTIAISGKTDPENTIYINDRFVPVENEGNFSYQLKLNDGENKLKIVARDTAGNETELIRTVTYSPS